MTLQRNWVKWLSDKIFTNCALYLLPVKYFLYYLPKWLPILPRLQFKANSKKYGRYWVEPFTV